MAQRRILSEIRSIQTAYTDIVRDVEVINDSSTKWLVTLINGVNLTLTFHCDHPFHPPNIEFNNYDEPVEIIKCMTKNSWSPAMESGKLMVLVHSLTERVLAPQRALRLMGILRCAPMMMLWRKRATERLYHPSRIDFEGELKELNALLF